MFQGLYNSIVIGDINTQVCAEMYNHVILKVIMITIMITLNFKNMIMIKVMISRKI